MRRGIGPTLSATAIPSACCIRGASSITSNLENILGARVRVDCTGEGLPTLVFIHGGACDGRDWDAQRRAFSSRCRVVTLDLPGHGTSPAPDEISMESLARTTTEVAKRYGGDQTVLIGHSLGCFIIAEMLRHSRCGISGIVFVEGTIAEASDAEAAIARLETVGFHAFTVPVYEQMFTSGSDSPLRRSVIARLKRMDAEFGRLLCLASLQWQVQLERSTFLAGVSTPTLVLQSAYLDQNFNWRSLKPGMTTPWTELVMRRSPNAELRIVPDVGHFPQIQAADTVNAYLDAFIRKVMCK